MPEPLYVLVNFVIIFIEVLSFAMLIRAILSLFMVNDNRFVRFVYVFTEPAVLPVRKLLVKMNWLQDSPIDFAFTISYLILCVVEILLKSLL